MWVPSHRDKEDKVVKTSRAYTLNDERFALNWFADKLAEASAAGAQVPDDVASVVIHNIKLTQLVQRRMTHIICSSGSQQQKVQYEPKPKVKQATVRELCDSSMHAVTFDAKEVHCMACKSSKSMSDPNLRRWLCAPCVPMQQDDLHMPARLHPINMYTVGKVPAHCSHTLFTLQGVMFCNSCGFYGSGHIRNLADKCTQSHTSHGRKALVAFWKGKLPQGVKPVFHRSSGVFHGAKPMRVADSSVQHTATVSESVNVVPRISCLDDPDATFPESQ